MKIHYALIVLLIAGCVSVDPKTGERLPRGNQRYKFETVERRAADLKDGMTKLQVHLLIGAPAEKSDDDDIWVYLPERPAVLIPSRALKLEFKNSIMIKHGYSPILLGQQL